jgi:anti-anti-sigma regulatory factor
MKSLEYKVSSKTENNTLTAKLELSGELTVKNASELKATIQEALQTSEILHLHIWNITNIDLSAVQIFCSLKKQLLPGKTITLTFDISQDLALLMSRSGFSSVLTDNEPKPLWKRQS